MQSISRERASIEERFITTWRIASLEPDLPYTTAHIAVEREIEAPEQAFRLHVFASFETPFASLSPSLV